MSGRHLCSSWLWSFELLRNRSIPGHFEGLCAVWVCPGWRPLTCLPLCLCLACSRLLSSPRMSVLGAEKSMQPPSSSLVATARCTELSTQIRGSQACPWGQLLFTRHPAHQGSQVCHSWAAKRTPCLAQRPYSWLGELLWGWVPGPPGLGTMQSRAHPLLQKHGSHENHLRRDPKQDPLTLVYDIREKANYTIWALLLAGRGGVGWGGLVLYKLELSGPGVPEPTRSLTLQGVWGLLSAQQSPELGWCRVSESESVPSQAQHEGVTWIPGPSGCSINICGMNTWGECPRGGGASRRGVLVAVSWPAGRGGEGRRSGNKHFSLWLGSQRPAWRGLLPNPFGNQGRWSGVWAWGSWAQKPTAAAPVPDGGQPEHLDTPTLPGGPEPQGSYLSCS